MNSPFCMKEASHFSPPSPDGTSSSVESERILSFGDDTSKAVGLADSPRLFNFPILPMLASSDEDEEASLVSSLSIDDSLLQHGRFAMNNDRFLDELVEPPQGHAPPKEIVTPVRLLSIGTSSSLSHWLIDTYETPSSPLSSSSCEDGWKPVGSVRLAKVEGTAEKIMNHQDIFRSLRQFSPVPRPELARRAATFPEAATCLTDLTTITSNPGPHTFRREMLQHSHQSSAFSQIPSVPVKVLRTDRNADCISRGGSETRRMGPRHSASLPTRRILVNGSMITHVHHTNMPFGALSMSSSADDAKLLGQRRRRVVGRGVSGTVSVGSLVGQSTFYTAPTSSSSTADIDTVESFRRHLKVQRMLNKFVAEPTSSHSHSSRIKREIKCVLSHVSSPIQRWIDKLSPKVHFRAAPSQVKLKRATGCLT